uniref:Uncharacterized protein n=1 Tax=Arundo donax TaxID=35708 RepID=A0A0A9AAT1_ARUDO
MSSRFHNTTSSNSYLLKTVVDNIAVTFSSKFEIHKSVGTTRVY